MIFISVVSVLSIIYDIVIHFTVKSEYESVMNDGRTDKYNVYWNLYQWSLLRLDATFFLGLTVILSWLNNVWADFYIITTPISFITFSYYAILIAVYPGQIANLNIVELEILT